MSGGRVCFLVLSVFFGTTGIVSAQGSCFHICNWCAGTCSHQACDVDDLVTCEPRENYCQSCTCTGCTQAQQCQGYTSTGEECRIHCVFDGNTCVVDRMACSGCELMSKEPSCEADCNNCHQRGCHYYRSTDGCNCDDCSLADACWGQSCGGSTPACAPGDDRNSCECAVDCRTAGACPECPEEEVCQHDDTGAACECKTCTSFSTCGMDKVLCAINEECVPNLASDACECRRRIPVDPTSTESLTTESDEISTSDSVSSFSVASVLVFSFFSVVLFV